MKATSALGWIASGLVLAGLYFGLDRYRRLPLDYGYGPDRRRFFAETLRHARLLEDVGSFSVDDTESWHLLGTWSESDVDAPRTAQRRATIVLPVLEPAPLEIELEVVPLLERVEVEMGVNGLPLGRASLEAPAHLYLDVPGSKLFRGDNTIYVYRSSRISSSAPWIALRRVTVRRKLPEGSDRTSALDGREDLRELHP